MPFLVKSYSVVRANIAGGLRRLFMLGVGALTIGVASVEAIDLEPTTFWKRIQEKGIYERVWERLRLYENDENSILQALSVVGRYQGQYWSFNSNQGSADDWENRRFFLGAEALLWHQLILHAQIKASEDLDPFYERMYQAFIRWSPDDAFALSVGRLDFGFTGLERSTSSTKIPTFERGLLVNQIMPGEVVGAVTEGKLESFSLRVGLLSGTIEDEFTEFRGGFGAVAGVARKLPLFYESGSLHLDYAFHNGNPANNAFDPYDHIITLWHQGTAGAFGLGLDATWADGLEGRPAVFGLTLLPTYVFAKDVIRKGDRLQAVVRYQFAVSEGDNGLQPQERYEQEVVPDGLGNRYHAFYAGINYLIFGDRFKLMTGTEYSAMHDSAHDDGAFDGWTHLAGVRIYF